MLQKFAEIAKNNFLNQTVEEQNAFIISTISNVTRVLQIKKSITIDTRKNNK